MEEGKTNFPRHPKQVDGSTWLTLTPTFYDRPTPLPIPTHSVHTPYLSFSALCCVLVPLCPFSRLHDR